MQSKNMRDYNLYIVCGACSIYFEAWLNLYASICEHVSYAIVHFYDLGLNEDHRRHIENLASASPLQLYIHTFDFDKYPDWVHISKNAGQWAWKPQCIKDVMDNYIENPNNSIIMWNDSCNVFINDLTDIINIVMHHSIYSPISSGSVKKWTHPDTIRYFQLEVISDLAMRNAAISAYYLGHPFVKKFINDYAKYCLLKNCIYPEGSNRQNHRQDQSVLTCLYYIYYLNYKFKIVNEQFGVNIHRRPPNFQQPVYD